MTAEKIIELSLNDALQWIRNAAFDGKPVTVEPDGKRVILRIEDNKFLVEDLPPHFPIVGCDLLNYSGLADLQQYFVGVLLPFEIWRARKYAKLEDEKSVVGTSGTGDGALIALKNDAESKWQPVLFAARLWYEGRDTAYGRGLRVALGLGSCIRGQEFGGVVQLQGYGLVETARILGCDKGTHVMLSLSYWEMLAEKVDAIEARGSYLGKNILLQRAKTIFSGKSKPDDRLETSYVNCFGKVEEDGGSWDFGVESDQDLSHPGKKDTPTQSKEPSSVE